MVKNYKLKIEITSPHKIQRLLKTIDVNAKEDRKEAKDLLAKVKSALSDYLENPPGQEEGSQPSGDTFHKLVQSAVLALNQAGIANERLLKLATLLQKFLADSSKKEKDLGTMPQSLFNEIGKLANNDEED